MDKAMKKRWIKNLESGEFPKARNYLARKSRDGKSIAGFCCLGVLAHTELSEEWETTDGFNFGLRPHKNSSYFDDTGIPERFARKLGITRLQQNELATLNDNNAGFDKAIEYIKKNL